MDAASGHQSDADQTGRLRLDSAAILEGLPDAVVGAASDGRIVFVNGLAEELFGYPRAELLGRPVQSLWPERVRERYVANMRLYFATEHPLRFSTEAWGLRRDGSEFVGEMSWGVVNTTAGPLLLAIGRDISERRAAEERLRAVAALGDRALAGADPADLAADAVELMTSTMPVDGAEVRLADGGALASSGPTRGAAVRLPIAAGDELVVAPQRQLTDEELNLVRAVAGILGTALARRRSEEQMRYEALHDPLTGLANRTLLRDRLEQALARSRREGRATAVLFVDLDNFKAVNDTYGHAVGDAVLVEIGRRLRRALRPADTVARLGGDEFVTVCEAPDQRSALMLGRRLQRAIALPLMAAGVRHAPSASIGISVGHDDPDALLSRADTAAYHAKAGGGGRVELSRQASKDPHGETGNRADARERPSQSEVTEQPGRRVKTTIGLIGVGRMGLAVCGKLSGAGFEVIAGDRQSERERAVRDVGGSWGGDTDVVAAAADVLITILPGSRELQDVMAIAIPALRAGSTWIDMTSSAPGVGQELVTRAHARGVECLDAPMGGGVAAATAGTLQLFVGGAADTVQRHRSLLEVLGSIEHVGDHGAGHTTKLIVNLLWFGQALATGEALLLARSAGIDLELVRAVLRRSAAASEFVHRDLEALLNGDYLDSFGLDRCCEELDAVNALAEELAVPFELSALVRDTYRRALARYGAVGGELLAVALLEEQAGVRLRSSRTQSDLNRS